MQRLEPQAQLQHEESLNSQVSSRTPRAEYQLEIAQAASPDFAAERLNTQSSPSPQPSVTVENDPQKIANLLSNTQSETVQIEAALQLSKIEKISTELLEVLKTVTLDSNRPMSVRIECLVCCTNKAKGAEQNEIAKELVKTIVFDNQIPQPLRIEAVQRYFPDSAQERREAVGRIFEGVDTPFDLKVRALHLLSSREPEQYTKLLGEFLASKDLNNQFLNSNQLNNLSSLVSSFSTTCPRACSNAIQNIVQDQNVSVAVKGELLKYRYRPETPEQIDWTAAIVQSNHLPEQLRAAAAISLTFSDTKIGADRLLSILKQTLREGNSADSVSRELMYGISKRGGLEEASALALKLLLQVSEDNPRITLMDSSVALLRHSADPKALEYLKQQIELGSPAKLKEAGLLPFLASSFRVDYVRTLASLATRNEEKLLLKVLTEPNETISSRYYAGEYFIGYNNDTANKLFRDILSDSPSVSQETKRSLSVIAAQALGRRGDSKDLELVERFILDQDSDQYSRVTVYERLAKNPTMEAQNLMAKLLYSDSTRGNEKIHIARALVMRNDERGISWIRGCISNYSDEYTVKSAIEVAANSGNREAIKVIFDAINGGYRNHIISVALADPNVQARFRAGLSNAAVQLKEPAMGEYALLLDEAARNRIQFPHRFSPFVLAQLLNQPPPKPETPRALVIFPTSDWNGAFGQFSNEIKQIMDNGYHLEFLEAKTEMDVVRFLNSKAHRGGADLIVLGAHGSQEAMSFGATDPRLNEDFNRAEAIDLEDVEMLKEKNVGQALKKGGSILLISCSVGDGEAVENNVVNMLRQVFPHAGKQQIFGATEPSSIRKIDFDKNKKLESVEYLNGKTYRADRSHTESDRKVA